MDLLCRLTGAEDALVVNNNAAAVLLCLMALARDREVIISRGQLVEIGGGFRIPEVLKTSGARLVEVGTTNRTHLDDYDKPSARPRPRFCVCTRSNFRQIGFTAEVSLAELVALGQQHALPVIDDLGSGTLLDTTAFGLAYEPRVQDSVQAGADAGHLQRRQAAGRSAGRTDRRPEVMRSPGCGPSADARAARRQDHPGRPGSHLGPLPARRGRDGRSPSGA